MGKGFERFNTIISFCVNASTLLHWLQLSAGGMLIAICGYLASLSNNLVASFGKPLAIMIGVFIALLIIGVLIGITLGIIKMHEIFSKEESSNRNTDFSQDLINTEDLFNPNKLASKLRDRDIENMADGIFNKNKQIFTYNDYHFEKYLTRFVFHEYGFNSIKKGKEQEMRIAFLPSIAKAVTINFDLGDSCKKYCKIYLIINEKPILVENISLPQFVCFEDDDKCVKFIVDFENNSFDYEEAYMEIRVKSFSI